MSGGVTRFPPLGAYADEEFGVHARHGTPEHREILFVEEVVDGGFQRQVRPCERKSLLDRDVAHVVGGEISRQGRVVARHGVTLAVIAPLI